MISDTTQGGELIPCRDYDLSWRGMRDAMRSAATMTMIHKTYSALLFLEETFFNLKLTS